MDTKEHILSVAQKLVQQRGFNGFSYADIAEEVGIRKASLHHHYATKAELGIALLASYSAQLDDELNRISALHEKADVKLAAYAAIFRGSLNAERMCMGGMLASEWLTLDPAMLPSLKRFFERNVEWLTEVLAEGKSQKLFSLSSSAADHARVLLSAMQGALLIARATGEHAAFDATTQLLLKSLTRKG
ncbi:MAG: TetR/AcrR family transcriptional regulator [Gallionella sp.]